MDSVINIIIDKLLDLGLSEEIFLVFLFLGFAYTIFQRFLKPLKEKLNLIPDEEYHDKNLKIQEKHREHNKKELMDRLNELEKTLNSLKESMISSDFKTSSTLKEVEKINNEVHNIKIVLSQFHGHMIYNKSDAFGNKGIE